MVLHEATLAWENNSKLCLLRYKFIHSSTVSHLFVRSFIQPATRSFLHSSTHSPNSYRAAASCQMLCLVLGRKRCVSPRLCSSRRPGGTEKQPPVEIGRQVGGAIRDHLPQPGSSAERSSKPRARRVSPTLLTVHGPRCRVSGVRRQVEKNPSSPLHHFWTT